MLCDILIGLLISGGIAASSVDLLESSTAAPVSSTVVLIIGPVLFLQYAFAAKTLNIANFYRKSGIRARDEQRAASLVVILLLAALYITAAWGVNYELKNTTTKIDRNMVVGWRIAITAYFGILFFYLSAIRQKSRAGIVAVTSLGAVVMVCALAIVAAARPSNPFFPTWVLVIQLFATGWAVLYDWGIYNGYCSTFSCGCCTTDNHVGPRFTDESLFENT